MADHMSWISQVTHCNNIFCRIFSPQALSTVGHHMSRKESIHHPLEMLSFLALQALCNFESSLSLPRFYFQKAARDGTSSCMFYYYRKSYPFRKNRSTICQGYKEYQNTTAKPQKHLYEPRHFLHPLLS